MHYLLLEGEIATMGALFTEIGTSVTTVLGWVTNVCSTIINTPLLAMSLVFFCIGGVAGLIGRLLSKN